MADRSTVRGTIRVQNLCMNKKVSVRYTTNNWMRAADLEAEYVLPSSAGSDGFSDQFSFKLSTAPLAVGQKIQFCLRYEPLDHGGEFWDNNDGKNYVFQCLSISKQPVSLSSSPSQGTSSIEHFWLEFLFKKLLQPVFWLHTLLKCLQMGSKTCLRIKMEFRALFLAKTQVHNFLLNCPQPIHMRRPSSSYSSNGNFSSNSTYSSNSNSGAGGYSRSNGGSTMSHSPSVFSEDPWLRYL